jgi:hypothetical protein
MIFTILLWIPAVVLLWRTIVSKQHWPVRMGAAAAAMLTLVGSFTVRGSEGGFQLDGTREWVALALCAAGPAYLFLWSRKHHGRRRSKTVSLLASIVGFVPILAAILFTLMSAE